MSRRTVTDQKGLDKALADNVTEIIISSAEGVWLNLSDSDSSHVVAWGSSHVEARGSSHVEAWGSSHVVAWGSSHVEAWGSSHVVAWGSSHVEARGSSHVVAWDTSHVEARGSSHVEARGSSHVEAWGSSHVEARDTSHVVARKYVAVHLHSQHVTLTGGVVIDMTAVDARVTEQWLDLTGSPVAEGRITVWKAVRADLRSAHGALYEVGSEVTCTDFRDDHDCARGLHFSPSVTQANGYDDQATRFLRCEVLASEASCIDSSKLKAPRCWVIEEVDRFGKSIGDKS